MESPAPGPRPPTAARAPSSPPPHTWGTCRRRPCASRNRTSAATPPRCCWRLAPRCSLSCVSSSSALSSLLMADGCREPERRELLLRGRRAGAVRLEHRVFGRLAVVLLELLVELIVGLLKINQRHARGTTKDRRRVLTEELEPVGRVPAFVEPQRRGPR